MKARSGTTIYKLCGRLVMLQPTYSKTFGERDTVAPIFAWYPCGVSVHRRVNVAHGWPLCPLQPCCPAILPSILAMLRTVLLAYTSPHSGFALACHQSQNTKLCDGPAQTHKSKEVLSLSTERYQVVSSFFHGLLTFFEAYLFRKCGFVPLSDLLHFSPCFTHESC